MIPLSRPDLTKADRDAVAKVLRTPTLSLGPRVPEFEERLARWMGVKHAVAVANGTAGLHLCVRALDLARGDEVITTPFSFVASANVILYEGARPVFVDIDEETLNLDVKAIPAAVTSRTRAVLPVHVFGLPCEIGEVMKLARKHGLRVVEDSCEAIGATFRGRKVGTFGESAVFAFYPNKQMTTGEGGIIVTNEKELCDLFRSLRNQGRPADGGWLEHPRMGYNYRLDEMSAALGGSQIRRIDAMLRLRTQVAARYHELLAKVPGVRTLGCPPHMTRSWFVYVVRLPMGTDRDRVMSRLRGKGVSCAKYFPCIHLQPYMRELGYREGQFPVCERVARETLALPFHNRLPYADQVRVVRALRSALR